MVSKWNTAIHICVNVCSFGRDTHMLCRSGSAALSQCTLCSTSYFVVFFNISLLFYLFFICIRILFVHTSHSHSQLICFNGTAVVRFTTLRSKNVLWRHRRAHRVLLYAGWWATICCVLYEPQLTTIACARQAIRFCVNKFSDARGHIFFNELYLIAINCP